MPTPYTGNPGALSARANPSFNEPADGDDLAAASVNSPLQTLADAVAFLMNHAALMGIDNDADWTGSGIAPDLSAGIFAFDDFETFPTKALIFSFRIAVDEWVRVYFDVEHFAFFFTYNASWNGVSWIRDTVATPVRIKLGLMLTEFTPEGAVGIFYAPTGATGSVINETDWGGANGSLSLAMPSSPDGDGTIDSVLGVQGAGSTDNYAALGGYGQAASSVWTGCAFRKLYPSIPSSFTLTDIGTNANLTGHPGASNPTTYGVQVGATVNVTAGFGFAETVTVS